MHISKTRASSSGTDYLVSIEFTIYLHYFYFYNVSTTTTKKKSTFKVLRIKKIPIS
jgi:hypothetical protein